MPFDLKLKPHTVQKGYAKMCAVTARFPHLDENARFTVQQAVADRLRPLYLEGAAERQLGAVGRSNLGDVNVYSISHAGPHFCMGLSYAFAMSRFMVVHRSMALYHLNDRRHHVENALRIRSALIWGGLDKKMRGAGA